MNQEETNSCMLRILPVELQAEANRVALEENPDNMPSESEGASHKELAALTESGGNPAEP